MTFVYTLDYIEKEISSLEKTLSKYVGSDEEGYYLKGVTGAQKIKYLIEKDCIVAEYGPGLVLVNDRYVLAYRGHKWRISGKSRWYDYGKIEDFYEKYIERNALNITPARIVGVIEGFKLSVSYNRPTWTVNTGSLSGSGDELRDAICDFLKNVDESKKIKLQADIAQEEEA